MKKRIRRKTIHAVTVSPVIISAVLPLMNDKKDSNYDVPGQFTADQFDLETEVNL